MSSPEGVFRPLTVAVTGGIGAGKSTVSRRLGELGAVVIDSDLLAREVVAPGTDGLAAIVEAFGALVVDDNGALDRPALGAIVFGSAEARQRLEAITHPLVRALFDRRVAEVGAEGLVVNDIPLLRTMQDAIRYHLVITVGMADEQVRIDRLVARGHTESDARARIAAQIDDDVRRALSDVWLDNSGTAAALRTEVDRIDTRLRAFGANRTGRTAVPGPQPGGGVPDGPVRHRLLAALPGSHLDADGRLMLPESTDRAEPDGRLSESLYDNGFGWLEEATGSGGRMIGNCDPGRGFGVPVLRMS